MALCCAYLIKQDINQKNNALTLTFAPSKHYARGLKILSDTISETDDELNATGPGRFIINAEFGHQIKPDWLKSKKNFPLLVNMSIQCLQGQNEIKVPITQAIEPVKRINTYETSRWAYKA